MRISELIREKKEKHNQHNINSGRAGPNPCFPPKTTSMHWATCEKTKPPHHALGPLGWGYKHGVVLP